jgi:ABC-type multidrug transport system fused ATPase/permease subunit
MDDSQESRHLASNWREYLHDIWETFRVFQWVVSEFVNRLSRRWQVYALIAQLLATIFSILSPFTLRYLVDGLMTRDQNLVFWSLGAMAVSMVASRLCSWIFLYYREYSLGEDQLCVDVRSTQLFLGKSLGQHLQDSGVLSAANVEKGRHRVVEIEYTILFDGVMISLNILVSFIFLFALSWVAGVVMVALLVSYFWWMIYVNRRIVVETTPLDDEYRRINRYLRERWEYPERVKTSGKEDEEVAYLGTWYRDYIRRDRAFWLWFIRSLNLRHLVYDLLIVVPLIIYAVWLVWSGTMTVGSLFPFISWVRRIEDDVWRIGQIEQRTNRNMPSIRSMREALTMPAEVTDISNPQHLAVDQSVEVRFENVGYAYPRGDGENAEKKNPAVLRDVSFSIAPGERVALIGPSGVGKTSVMRLLQRFMDPSEGRILVAGVDLRELQLRDWQRLIGYIPQQPQVLDGTIRYNLLYGLTPEERERVSDEELERVVHLLQIDFGERLVDGLETVVGRHGIKLSGGQAQRLMVGAAVLKNPRFMVIDEATSSLDSTTEKAVQAGLQEILGSDVSVLVVTHRLSTIRGLCTKFVVLRSLSGQDTAQTQVEAIAGSFEELATASPTFRQLAVDQGIAL